MKPLEGIHLVFLALYILMIQGINLILLLIADFYQKKFEQSSPRLGFIAALIAGLCAGFVLLLHDYLLPVFGALLPYLLVLCGVLSLASSISLLLTMKRVRK